MPRCTSSFPAAITPSSSARSSKIHTREGDAAALLPQRLSRDSRLMQPMRDTLRTAFRRVLRLPNRRKEIAARHSRSHPRLPLGDPRQRPRHHDLSAARLQRSRRRPLSRALHAGRPESLRSRARVHPRPALAPARSGGRSDRRANRAADDHRRHRQHRRRRASTNTRRRTIRRGTAAARRTITAGCSSRS